jgi:hypothetical protein
MQEFLKKNESLTFLSLCIHTICYETGDIEHIAYRNLTFVACVFVLAVVVTEPLSSNIKEFNKGIKQADTKKPN